MIGIIVAVNPDWIIGKDGTIPWRYPGDLRRFARVTAGSTVIMGRKTWESIPAKFRPLKGRTNIVVTSQLGLALKLGAGIVAARDPETAIAFARGEYESGIDPSRPVWFIGGRSIYEAAIPLADVIDVTFVPDVVAREGSVRFPLEAIDVFRWTIGDTVTHEDEPTLKRAIYTRRRAPDLRDAYPAPEGEEAP